MYIYTETARVKTLRDLSYYVFYYLNYDLLYLNKVLLRIIFFPLDGANVQSVFWDILQQGEANLNTPIKYIYSSTLLYLSTMLRYL